MFDSVHRGSSLTNEKELGRLNNLWNMIVFHERDVLFLSYPEVTGGIFLAGVTGWLETVNKWAGAGLVVVVRCIDGNKS